MNNEKREEIYLLTSQINTLEKELRLWIYDFDKIKLNNDLRVNYNKITQNRLK